MSAMPLKAHTTHIWTSSLVTLLSADVNMKGKYKVQRILNTLPTFYPELETALYALSKKC